MAALPIWCTARRLQTPDAVRKGDSMKPYKGFMIPTWEDVLTHPSQNSPLANANVMVPAIDGSMSLILKITKESVLTMPQKNGDELLEKEAKEAVDQWIEASSSLGDE